MTLFDMVAVVVGPTINYVLASRRVRRAHARMRDCPNPLHRAEAARRAAVMQVGACAETAWFASLLVAWTLLPIEDAPLGAAFGLVAVALLLVLAGGMVAHLWVARRCRTIGLSESLCS